MTIVEAKVEAGSRANQKRKNDQLALCCRDERGGGRGDSDGASDNDVVLSVNEHKRAMISHGESAGRGGFGMIRGGLGVVRAFLSLYDGACSFSIV